MNSTISKGEGAADGPDESTPSFKDSRSAAPENRVDILYQAICYQEGRPSKVFLNDRPFKGIEENDNRESEAISVIEVVTEVWGNDKTGKPSQNKADYQSRPKDEIDFITDFEPKTLVKPTVIIHSRAIRDTLRRLVLYYPSQTLTGSRVTVLYPYRVLLHYFQEIQAFKNSYPRQEPMLDCVGELSDASIPSSPKATCDENTAHDLEVLLKYLVPHYHRRVEPELACHRKPQPTATFDLLWFLFKPGEDVYGKVNDELAGFVIQDVEYLDTANNSPDRRKGVTDQPKRCVVTVWNLCFKGRKLFRRTYHFSILKYEGEREIMSLYIFPSRFLDATDGGVTRKQLEDRGHLYYEYLKKVPLHMNYSGETLDQEFSAEIGALSKDLKRYDGQIIIDPKAYEDKWPRQRRRRGRRSSPESSDSEYDEGEDSEDEPLDFGGGPRWSQHRKIDPAANPTLDSHCYFLLPAAIKGFALKEKIFMTFKITDIKPLEWPPEVDCAINQLVLPPDCYDVEFLKVLSRRKDSPRKETVWAADPIRGKGAGQLFLLHGPPGTGKTYTIECIAEYTRRPLLSLAITDLEDSAAPLRNLVRWFNLAEKWQAILQIDEVDVFLEKRRGNNLYRNGLVSVFLQMVEYYSGVLFFTTNRLGEIDDAFLSRIHVAIGFETLSEDARVRIWNNFFCRLKKERPEISIPERTKIELYKDEILKKLELNGREIRNVLQTAITLATAEEDSKCTDGPSKFIQVNLDHFQRVLERRRMFVEDTNCIREMTIEKRAFSDGLRRDRRMRRESSRRTDRRSSEDEMQEERESSGGKIYRGSRAFMDEKGPFPSTRISG